MFPIGDVFVDDVTEAFLASWCWSLQGVEGRGRRERLDAQPLHPSLHSPLHLLLPCTIPLHLCCILSQALPSLRLSYASTLSPLGPSAPHHSGDHTGPKKTAIQGNWPGLHISLHNHHHPPTSCGPQPTTPNPTCTLVALLVPQPLAHLPTHCLSFSRAVDPPHL